MKQIKHDFHCFNFITCGTSTVYIDEADRQNILEPV